MTMRIGCSLYVVVALTCVATRARAQLQEATDEKIVNQVQQQRESPTTVNTPGEHNFVAPLSLLTLPFEFAIPVSRVDSQTQVGFSFVSGERDGMQIPSDTHYVAATQVYGASIQFGHRWELALSGIGRAASGTEGAAIVAGGLAAQGGPAVALAFRILKRNGVSWTVRVGPRIEWGERANVQPLLYQLQASPLQLLSNFDPALVATPGRDFNLAFGSSVAWAARPNISAQFSARLDAGWTWLKPWLSQTGTEAEGVRPLTYVNWNPTLGAALGVYIKNVLIQPQLGLSYRSQHLIHPNQDRGAHAYSPSFLVATQIMYLASSILQLGGGLGLEVAPTDIQDTYRNTYSTLSLTPFLQLVARFITEKKEEPRR